MGEDFTPEKSKKSWPLVAALIFVLAVIIFFVWRFGWNVEQGEILK